MSLKAELETWASALKAYEEEDLEKSLYLFSVRLYLFNFPPSWSTDGVTDYSRFVQDLNKYRSHTCHSGRTWACRRTIHSRYSARSISGCCVSLSIWFFALIYLLKLCRKNAIRYFQCGVSNFLLGRYELALKDFEEALLYLRGNQAMWVLFACAQPCQFSLSLSNCWLISGPSVGLSMGYLCGWGGGGGRHSHLPWIHLEATEHWHTVLLDNRNYEQIGLKFKLFSAEVLFNKGLSLIYMGNL